MMERLTARAKRALSIAKQEAIKLGDDYIGTEHILLALFFDGASLASQLLDLMGVSEEEIRRNLKNVNSLSSESLDNDIGFDPEAKHAIQRALEEATSMGKDYIGTEHLFLGIVSEKESHASILLDSVGIVNARDVIYRALGLNVSETVSNKSSKASGAKATSNIDKLKDFGRNLNEFAKAGKIDPVIGRQKEIERVIQILCRRTKNNPVLIGEPGVGKTAIAEGLAQKIIEGKVPEILRDKIIFSLEMGSLLAGTKYRGEFEERLKNLVDVVREAKNIILFIDELHTLIGAGAAEGAVDAANLLKPALSRGEIQSIGATTMDEYKKYIEKDAALERRFQPVVVDVPNTEDSLEILKGLRDRYEAFHKAKITDEALVAAVKLSDRYINDRHLPDKAIDLMDEACSRVRLKAFSLPPSLKDMENKLSRLKAEKEAAITAQDFEVAAKIRDEEKTISEDLLEKQKSWKHNQADKIIVNESDIAEVVSSWTNIPLSKLTQSEANKLLNLEVELHQRVIGQDEAVSSVSRAVRRARSGFHDPKRPVGSFLFLGPTGVGKTELAKALAENLFGDETSMIRFDMSEYMEKHTVSRFVGAPPGYVGYDEGGQLIDAVRRKPYCVILLDEIEKAHPDVFNILLQVLEDGRLTDGQGRTADFRNAVIIMTSNVGSSYLSMTSQVKKVGFSTADKSEEYSEQTVRNKVMDEVKKTFRPEFINRIDEVVIFNALTENELAQIVSILFKNINERALENGLVLEVTAEGEKAILKNGQDKHYGARPLKRAMQKLVEDEVAELYLKGEIKEGDTVFIDSPDGDKVVVSRKNKDV